MDAPYDELEKKLASLQELLARAGAGRAALELLSEVRADFRTLKEDREVMQMIYAAREARNRSPTPQC